jgi:hypothetical protein
VALGQRDPDLDALQALRAPACLGIGAFGVDDAAAGRHPVDVAGRDRLDEAEAVAMDDFTREEIGDGGEADMRVRANVDAAAGRELDRAELVEEDERADHAALRRRQHALHREAVAEVAGAGEDLVLDEGGGWVIHGSFLRPPTSNGQARRHDVAIEEQSSVVSHWSCRTHRARPRCD